MNPMDSQKNAKQRVWINPVGGYGDMLMVSGVLKLVVESTPKRTFNLVRRTKYLTFLKGHPAIVEIGFAPKDASLISTDYWAKERLGANDQRAFQVLARSFGLETPVEEKLYVNRKEKVNPVLLNMIPWGKKNVLIAPGSASGRKMMQPQLWQRLVQLLKAEGFFVLQAGRLGDVHISNAYSLLGLTTPHQLISLLEGVDVAITPDNFAMHAAHLVGGRAVVLWGPTLPEVYGYPEQIHIKADRPCQLNGTVDCLDPVQNENKFVYNTPCQFGEDHCMNRIPVQKIFEAVKAQIKD